MDDNKIVRLFYERSEQAIEELSKKYGSFCHTIAVNILKNQSDAEECVNDAYLGAWNTIPPQNPNPLLSYIAKFVKRYWYANSISEIADVFQISNHNVTMRLSRTREKLRNFLLKEGVEI